MNLESPYDREQRLIREAIARFPETFGLRAFPGDVFRISPRSSYVQTGTDNVLLYSEIKNGDKWKSFAKGTEAELRAQIAEVAR